MISAVTQKTLLKSNSCTLSLSGKRDGQELDYFMKAVIMEKLCSKCGQAALPKQSYCRECRNAYAREYKSQPHVKAKIKATNLANREIAMANARRRRAEEEAAITIKYKFGIDI